MRSCETRPLASCTNISDRPQSLRRSIPPTSQIPRITKRSARVEFQKSSLMYLFSMTMVPVARRLVGLNSLTAFTQMIKPTIPSVRVIIFFTALLALAQVISGITSGSVNPILGCIFRTDWPLSEMILQAFLIFLVGTASYRPSMRSWRPTVRSLFVKAKRIPPIILTGGPMLLLWVRRLRYSVRLINIWDGLHRPPQALSIGKRWTFFREPTSRLICSSATLSLQGLVRGPLMTRIPTSTSKRPPVRTELV